MKYFLAATLIALTAVLSARFIKADPPNDLQASARSPVSPLMQMKLDKSRSILEGLAMEDYDAIAANAKALRLLSLEAGWNVIQTKEYATQSQEFRRATDVIAEAAGEEDISRAALGYVSLTVRCVECHSYMRKHKVEMLKRESN